jgi:predicted permease
MLLRSTLAPAFMVLVATLLGFKRDLAVALVILSILPVAQTAFVICKQYDLGTHQITAAMVASLLMMLPQLMVTMAVLDWSGVFL